jgi:hypothetical protein
VQKTSSPTSCTRSPAMMNTLYERLTLIVADGVVEHVFQPIP